MKKLTIDLLGTVEFRLNDGPPLPLSPGKTSALLAYLAVEAAHPHARQALAELFWPERADTEALGALRFALSNLRAMLRDRDAPVPRLLINRSRVQINPQVELWVDVTAFREQAAALCDAQARSVAALREVLALYRGPFLQGFNLGDSLDFESWALRTRESLERLRLRLLHYLGTGEEAAGDHAQAAETYRAILETQPWDEEAHRGVMRALAAAGEHGAALVQYAACRRALGDLGIAPGCATIALYQRIKQTSDASSGAEASSGALFVARERELARLERALDWMLAGQGQMLFVSGAAGSGKTALLDAFAQRALAARADVLLVQGRGNAYTGLGNPYWPFIEMAQQLRGQAGIGGARGAAQRLAEAYPQLLPLLTAHSPDLARLTGNLPLDAPGQATLFDQLTRALEAIATRYPLVLLLDDAQWADRDSLNLLFHLGRRLAGQRILLVVAFRPDVLDVGYSTRVYLREPDAGRRHPLAQLLNEAQRLWGDLHIDLAQAEGQRFIDALLNTEPNHLGPAFRETLYRHTGGHALFTTELLRGMQERGDLVRDARGYWIEGPHIAWRTLPTRIEAVIAERIGQLLPDWQAMLTLASVEGDEFTVQVLARAHHLPEAEISRRLSGVLSRHHYLVAPVGVQRVGTRDLARYRFRHLLFQKYLYQRLDPVECAQLHLAVGDALEALYAERAGDISLALARHFELGGAAGKASGYLLQAGKRAMHLAATEEALRLLTRGLTLLAQVESGPERAHLEAELQLTLGTALLPKGWSAPERAQALERAYALCQHTGATPQLARSLLQLADINLARGQRRQALAVGEQLLTLAQSTQDPLIASYAHYVLGMLGFFEGELAPARRHLEQALIHTQDPPTVTAALAEHDIGVRSMVWLSLLLWALGYPEQAAACSRQAAASARAAEHTFSLRFALSVGALSIHWLRRDRPALHATLRELAALRSAADPDMFWHWSVIFQAWLAAIEQHDPDSPARLQQAIAQWETDDVRGGHVYQHLLLAEAYLALEQIEAARVTLDHTLAHIAETGLHFFFEAETQRLIGETERRLGHLAEAAASFQRAATHAAAQGALGWELRASLSLCRLYQATGATDDLTAARARLAALCARFTEGRETPDYQAAQAMLVLPV